MPSGTQLWTALLAGADCPLLVLAAGTATAAVRHEHAVHGPVVLASAAYAFGLARLLAARLLGTGRARLPVRARAVTGMRWLTERTLAWLPSYEHSRPRRHVVQEARELFDKLLYLRNDLGLLAEEWDPRFNRQIGNCPQTLSYGPLIQGTWHLVPAATPSEYGLPAGALYPAPSSSSINTRRSARAVAQVSDGRSLCGPGLVTPEFLPSYKPLLSAIRRKQSWTIHVYAGSWTPAVGDVIRGHR